MCDKTLLLAKMRQCQINARQLSRLIGLSGSAFSRRINGKSSFMTDEVEQLCEILSITANAEKIRIFLL